MSNDESSAWEGKLRSGELDGGIRLLLTEIASSDSADEANTLAESDAKWLADYKSRRELLRNSSIWISKNGGVKLRALLQEDRSDIEIAFTGPVDEKTKRPAIAKCRFALTDILSLNWETPSVGVPIDLVLVNAQAERYQRFGELVKMQPAPLRPQSTVQDGQRKDGVEHPLALGGSDARGLQQRSFEVHFASSIGELEVTCSKKCEEDCVVAIVQFEGSRNVVTLESRVDVPHKLVARILVPERLRNAERIFATVDEVPLDELPSLSAEQYSAWCSTKELIVFPICKQSTGYRLSATNCLPQADKLVGPLDLVIRVAAIQGE